GSHGVPRRSGSASTAPQRVAVGEFTGRRAPVAGLHCSPYAQVPARSVGDARHAVHIDRLRLEYQDRVTRKARNLMQVRAAVLRRPGAPLDLAEIDLEAPQPDEVLVRLVSVGICRTDTHA